MSSSTFDLSYPKLISSTFATTLLALVPPSVFYGSPQSGTPLGARFLPTFYAPLAYFTAKPVFFAATPAALLTSLGFFAQLRRKASERRT